MSEELSWRIKPESNTTQLTINKDNITRYHLHPRARSVRINHIRKLEAVIRRGLPFNDPLIINLNVASGEVIIIDGQHRFLAIRNVIANNPDVRVIVHVIQYKNLDLEQMNEVYKIHAKSVKQNLNDRLEMEQDQNPVLKELLSGDFPVAISTKSRDAQNLSRLLNAYFNKYLEPERQTRTSTDSFMYGVNRLTLNDKNRLAEFCIIHQELFGRPGKENRYCDRGALYVLMKIYFHNVDKKGFDSDDVKNRLRLLVGDPNIIANSKQFDAISLRELYDHCLLRMNARYRGENRLEAIPLGREVKNA